MNVWISFRGKNMIVIMDFRKPRKSMMNAFIPNPVCLGSMLLSNSSYTQGIFNLLGIVGYPTLYTFFEITKIKDAVSPYSLSKFHKYYNQT
jgi:hypothetical protein